MVKHHYSSVRRITRCSTSLLALLPVVAAMSLADAAYAAPADANANSGVDELVITAQHRAQSDKDVAEAVSAINPENLDEYSTGGADITFLNGRVPSLYVSSSFGRTYPVMSIRGLGDNDFDYNAQQPVSVIYDGVVLLNPILKAFPVFDTVGLEVAKGPQGTLYGTDTPGGVIKIDSKKPSDQFDAYVDVSYGNYNTVSSNGAVGGPIVPGKLSMRISLLEDYRDNWVHNDYAADTRAQNVNGYNDAAGRLQFLFTPSDSVSFLLNMHARSLEGTSTLFRANAEEPGTNKLAPGYSIDNIAFDDLYTQKLRTRGVTLTSDFDLGLVKVTSISGWETGHVLSRGDLDGGYIAPNGATNIPPAYFEVATQDMVPSLEQYSQEVRLYNDPNSRLFNQGGVFFFHDMYQDYTTSFNTPSDNPVGYLINTHQSAVSAGVFDSISYKVTDALTTTGGVRYSGDFKDYSTQLYGGGVFVAPNPPFTSKARLGGTAVSWDFSTNYKIDDDLSVYARIARGGKGPAVEGRVGPGSPGISTAKAEASTSEEIGFKSTLFDKKAKLNFDVYRWDDRDAQLTSAGGVGNSISIQNVPHLRGYGFEAEGEAMPIPALSIVAGISYNHTRIDAPGAYTTGCGDGCTYLEPTTVINGTPYAPLNGLPLQNAPEWIANWTIRYDYQLNDSAGLYGATDWVYRGSTLTTAYESVESYVAPLLLGGLRIGYVNYDHDYDISAYVRNIANTVQPIGVAIDFIPNDKNAYINDPRTFGIEVKKHF